MTDKRKAGRPVAHIGFQLPDQNAHDVAGYCAAEMAVEEANERGELPFTVDLVPFADERDPEVSRKVARQFVEDPLGVGVLGPLNSAMAVASQDIYHEAGMAQLTSEASAPVLTSKGYKNFRRLVANDKYHAAELARAGVLYLEGKRIAVLHDSTAWGTPISEIFAAEVQRLGSECVLFRGFGDQENKLNFEDMVEATVRADPDLVFFGIYWHKAHIIAHKLRYAGFTAPFLGSSALKPYAFLEVPSFDVVKPYHSSPYVDIRVKPSARGLLDRFARRYPLMLVAPHAAAEGYDSASLLLEAMKRAGTVDRAKVLAELQSIEHFVGAIGPIEFDENGDLIDPDIALYQCVDGLRKYVGVIRDLLA
jgi:branched-chain amino acid transport system substrate-binding protein